MLSQEEKEWINQHRSVGGRVKRDFTIKTDVSGDFDPEKLRSVFFKSIPVVAVILMLSGVAAWLYLRYTPPLYESSSLLKLDVKKESNIFGFGGFDAYGDPGANLAGELELIQSNVIYDQVIKKPELRVSYFYQGKILSEEKYKSSPFDIQITDLSNNLFDKNISLKLAADSSFVLSYPSPEGKELSLKGKSGDHIETQELKARLTVTNHFKDGQVPGTFYFRVNSNSALLNYLASSLQAIVINPNARTIRVSFHDFNRFKAKDIVDAIDSVYLLETVNSKNLAADQTIEFLNYQLSITDDSLMIAEERIEKFIRENKQVKSERGLENTIDQISSLESEKFALRTDLQSLDTFKKSLASNEPGVDFIPDISYVSNSSLQKFIEEYNQQKSKYSRISVSRKENTMAMQNIKRRMESLEKNLVRLIDKEIQSFQRKINSIDQRVAQYEQELRNLPQKEAEYTRLKRHSDLYEKFYLLMMDRKAQYGINKSGTIPDFRVLSQAAIPDYPVSPRRGLVYGGAMAGGFALSLMFLVISYLLSNKITSQNEVERLISAPVLGSVPQYVKGKMEFSKLVIGENPKSQISEAFRSIRTNMDFIIQKKSGKLISVTSTISGEGKTFVAVNLGGIIALTDQKVVILDLDLRKPKLHLAFETPNDSGMSNLLIGKAKLDSCIHKSPIKGLDFITAGPIPPNPAELMLNENFDKILKDLSKQYDVVIVDTPPVGIVADAVMLMKKADLPIYVLRSGFSKKEFCKNINRIKQTFALDHLTVVLNASGPIRRYGYGNSRSFGYGYYEDEKKSFLQKFFGS